MNKQMSGAAANQRYITIRGAREHNLKNVSLRIPRDKLVVLTGLSGSGKSSLAFDTIYAEGQRRYVESLSSYARQFLGQMEKPDVDAIEGLSPAISIDQKTTSKNPRSTVGTVTEIYDYLRLLYARVGTPHCPRCGREIRRQTVDQILDAITSHAEGTRLIIMAPLVRGRKGEFGKLLADLRRQGFVRIRLDGELHELDEELTIEKRRKHDLSLVVDRLVLRGDMGRRLADSVELALKMGEGLLQVEYQTRLTEDEAAELEARRLAEAGLQAPAHGQPVPAAAEAQAETGPDPADMAPAEPQGSLLPAASAHAATFAAANQTDRVERGFHIHEELYSQNFACPDCHISLGEIEPRLFSFNNPAGACPDCLGIGYNAHVDEELIVSDPNLSLNQGAIRFAGWNFDDTSSWGRSYIEALAARYGFSLDTPWARLPAKIRHIIMYGNDGEVLSIDTTNSKYSHGSDYRSAWEGIIPSTERRYAETSSDDMKAYYEQFMTTVPCPTCGGARLKPEALAVTYDGLNIYDLTNLPIRRIRSALHHPQLTRTQQQIAAQILRELDGRLQFLIDVGLDYMTLSRPSATLSGGEAQRIRLATQIGSGLMGVLYILDEPSIGLHQRDNDRLLATLKHLRDLGNTVLVVEHDEDTMWASDYIVDMGPGAGEKGGEVVAAGTAEEICQVPESITGQYLSHRRFIPVPARRRRGNGHWLSIQGASLHNLKSLSVRIPLGAFTCVTGVSGSGKSSLINGVLLPRLETLLNGARRKAGSHKAIKGYEQLDKVIAIDQSPIGRTPRSNPATYTGVFDLIRQLFAATSEARARGYQPGRFSFNVKGGRCEACSGDGVNKIEMHFLPDIYVPCEVCHGQRYNRETLEVRYKGKNIADVLGMTIDEACEFFAAIPRIYNKLKTLQEVGLGYTRLGQPSTQLSGGEAQRVKLATELARRSTGQTLYILDEPTTGLHIADVHKLIDILQRLTDAGNTVVVIEHNLDVIKTADYLLDLGPEGGENGGTLVACGTPEAVAAVPTSYTGQYLQKILARDRQA